MAILDLIGPSPKFQAVLDEIGMVAPVGCTSWFNAKRAPARKLSGRRFTRPAPVQRSSSKTARNSHGRDAVFRISGNIQSEDIPQLAAEIQRGIRIEALDLEELGLVSPKKGWQHTCNVPRESED
jgi:hypothetical protein